MEQRQLEGRAGGRGQHEHACFETARQPAGAPALERERQLDEADRRPAHAEEVRRVEQRGRWRYHVARGHAGQVDEQREAAGPGQPEMAPPLPPPPPEVGVDEAKSIERDSMGEMRRAGATRSGARRRSARSRTSRSAGWRFPRGFVRALGLVKQAAARGSTRTSACSTPRLAARHSRAPPTRSPTGRSTPTSWSTSSRPAPAPRPT